MTSVGGVVRGLHVCMWAAVCLLGGRDSVEGQAERKKKRGSDGGGGEGGEGGGRVLILAAIVP